MKIDDYGFNMHGTVPDAKDIYEAAIEYITDYEMQSPADETYTVTSDVVETDDRWYMKIKTSKGAYVVDNIEHHEPDGPDNYITFTLYKDFTLLN